MPNFDIGSMDRECPRPARTRQPHKQTGRVRQKGAPGKEVFRDHPSAGHGEEGTSPQFYQPHSRRKRHVLLSPVMKIWLFSQKETALCNAWIRRCKNLT